MDISIIIPAYKPGEQLISLIKLLHDLRPSLQITVIDDGSGPDFSSIFSAIEHEPKTTVLRHEINQGKGAALKTAFRFILATKSENSGIVTADADGQHLPEDILKVCDALQIHSSSLILGCRVFKDDVPLRSKFGNILTRKISRIILAKDISDTQTGLRGLPYSMLSTLLGLSTTGYDFEMDMLRHMAPRSEIVEVPITTVYLDNNKHSHFNPFLDSLAIYFVLLRHASNSLLTALIDYIVFSLIFLLSGSIITSLTIARVLAGLFNFFIGKRYVFMSKSNILQEFIKYTLTVIGLGIIAYVGITWLKELGVSVLLAKVITEFAIFVVSFYIQRTYIFSIRRPR